MHRVIITALAAAMFSPAVAAGPVSPQGLLADLYRADITVDTCGIVEPAELISDMHIMVLKIEKAIGFDDTMKKTAHDQMREGMVAAGVNCDEYDLIVERMHSAVTLATEFDISAVSAPDDINTLSGLYLTVAVSEYCKIAIDPGAAAVIGNDAFELEAALGLTAERSEERYQEVLSRVRASAPDCSSASNDIAVMREVLAAYGNPNTGAE